MSLTGDPDGRAVPGRDLGLRRDGRAARDHRGAGGAERPARERPGPARRGQPALLRALRPGQPGQRVRRRRCGAVPDGQQPPEPVPLRAAAVRGRRPDHHRRQQRPVPQAGRGARRPGARRRPPVRPERGPHRQPRPSSGRSWWSGCAPARRWSGSATSSPPACRAGRSTPSTAASRSPRRSGSIPWSTWGRDRPPYRRCATRSGSPTTPPDYRLPPPSLDEHGEEIRRWLATPAARRPGQHRPAGRTGQERPA